MRDSQQTRPVREVRALREAARLGEGRAGAGNGGRVEAGDRSRAGAQQRPQPRRHARAGRMAALVRAFVPVVFAAAGLGVAVLVGIRWAEATAPAPARGVGPMVSGPSVSGPVHERLTPIPVPARAQAEALLQGIEPAEADWVHVLRELDARRSTAFARGDPAGLSGVYAPGSAALREETAELRQLRRAGLRTRGLWLAVRTAAVREVTSGRVVLNVVDQMPSYDLVNGRGQVVRRVPGRGDRSWRLTLVPLAKGAEDARDMTGGWRIAEIEPVQG